MKTQSLLFSSLGKMWVWNEKSGLPFAVLQKPGDTGWSPERPPLFLSPVQRRILLGDPGHVPADGKRGDSDPGHEDR